MATLEVAMTTIPVPRGVFQPREWAIGNRTLIVNASSKRALAVLDAPSPLLLPPGSIVQFDGQPGEFVVTGLRVIAGRLGGIVCVEVQPVPVTKRGSNPQAKFPSGRPRHLRPAPGA
jgi:hypothetical protein